MRSLNERSTRIEDRCPPDGKTEAGILFQIVLRAEAVVLEESMPGGATMLRLNDLTGPNESPEKD
jgi:hypothetical protein